MKTAVVFYSMSGNTEFVAKKVAEKLSADIIQIEPEKAYPDKGLKKFIWGGKSAVMGEKPTLLPYAFDAKKYDRIVFGFPIWASSYAPPIKTFIADNMEAIRHKRIAAFACCSGGSADKAFAKLKDFLEISELEAQLVLIDPNVTPSPDNEDNIAYFCTALS